jgi:hypothetical protein
MSLVELTSNTCAICASLVGREKTSFSGEDLFWFLRSNQKDPAWPPSFFLRLLGYQALLNLVLLLLWLPLTVAIWVSSMPRNRWV